MGLVGMESHARGQDSAPVVRPLGFAGRDPISALLVTVANLHGVTARAVFPLLILLVSLFLSFCATMD